MSIKPWECSQCGEPQTGQRHWCILWGPYLWRTDLPAKERKPRRQQVCSPCKKECGVYV